MKCCIILNGKINNYKFIKSKINNEKYNYIICADGGANHAYEMEIIPDFIIGDLDSAKEKIRERTTSNQKKIQRNFLEDRLDKETLSKLENIRRNR